MSTLVIESARRAPPASSFRSALRATAAGISAAFSGTYRPELHYMRGPGPKWREKHAMEPRARTDDADATFAARHAPA